jgi:hypothetical protein
MNAYAKLALRALHQARCDKGAGSPDPQRPFGSGGTRMLLTRPQLGHS